MKREWSSSNKVLTSNRHFSDHGSLPSISFLDLSEACKVFPEAYMGFNTALASSTILGSLSLLPLCSKVNITKWCQLQCSYAADPITVGDRMQPAVSSATRRSYLAHLTRRAKQYCFMIYGKNWRQEKYDLMKRDFWSAHYRCTQLHRINCKERLWVFVLYFALGFFLSLLDFLTTGFCCFRNSNLCFKVFFLYSYKCKKIFL